MYGNLALNPHKNTKAVMIYEPFSNMLIDMSNVPLIILTERRDEHGASLQKYGVAFGNDSMGVDFPTEHIAPLKGAIKRYNEQGGRIYALFSNVFVNVDIVQSVGCFNNMIYVQYPGGVWKSGRHQNAKELYQAYRDYALSVERNRDLDSIKVPEELRINKPPKP